MHKVNIITLKAGERGSVQSYSIKIRGHFVFPSSSECFSQSDSPEAEHCNVSVSIFLPQHTEFIYFVCQWYVLDYSHWAMSCSEGIIC